MSARKNPARLRIDRDGRLEVVDPGFDSLGLMQAIDPAFQIATAPLPGFVRPRIHSARSLSTGINRSRLETVRGAVLKIIHKRTLSAGMTEEGERCTSVEDASLLDVKIELARRALASCSLCARRCGINRLENEIGLCGLGTSVTVAENFIHIAEESPINPSMLISLAGCGLRCQYCQQWPLLDVRKIEGTPLTGELWDHLDLNGARSISFIGGNPDESLYAIFRFLKSIPEDWELPVIWNSHAYVLPETIALLDGVVDGYVPDFKYGSEACGLKLSGIANYPKTATKAIAEMLSQNVPVIVRMLVLPGHVECCHLPILEKLKKIANENLLISIRGQYCPDWRIQESDGDMARRPTSGEVEVVRTAARDLQLNSVDGDF